MFGGAAKGVSGGPASREKPNVADELRSEIDNLKRQITENTELQKAQNEKIEALELRIEEMGKGRKKANK